MGQVHRKETRWGLLNTEKPSLTEEAPELHTVRSLKSMLGKLGSVSAPLWYSSPAFIATCFWPLLEVGGGWLDLQPSLLYYTFL